MTMAENGRLSVPSVARELVDRLTVALDIPFTLTNEIGAVLASTSAHPRGHIEPGAIAVLQEGAAIEYAGPDGRPGAGLAADLDMPAAAMGGLLAGEAGVYLPVRVNG